MTDRLTTVRVLAAGAAMAAVLAGCGGAQDPAPVPSPSAATALNPEERAVYRQALRQVEAFESTNQRILAKGRATRRAKVFYRDHLKTWRPTYALLRSYEEEGIRTARLPVVLSTTATSIKSFQDNAAEVVLLRCTDQSDLGMTRAGQPVPATYDEPVAQDVVLIRYENLTWIIGEFTTTGEPCAG